MARPAAGAGLDLARPAALGPDAAELDTPGLAVAGLVKDYPAPSGLLRVLDGVDLRLAPGESASVMGASGCGKSTLLFVLGRHREPLCRRGPARGRGPP